jgi:hypothetical protein
MIEKWQVHPVPPVHGVPSAAVQGTLLQHCELIVHSCP